MPPHIIRRAGIALCGAFWLTVLPIAFYVFTGA